MIRNIIAAALVLGATDIPRFRMDVIRINPADTAARFDDPAGLYVLYGDVQPAIDAAVAEALAGCPGGLVWRTDTPERLDNKSELLHPIVAEVTPSRFEVQYYGVGSFRGLNWAQKPVPLRWTYILETP